MSDPLTLPLRDIHLPSPVAMWPPAIGWWILLGVSIIALCIAWVLYRRHQRKQHSAINLARGELARLESGFNQYQDTVQAVRAVSSLLRRLSISLFPRAETAGLTGEQWLHFLDAQLDEPVFSTGPGRILVEAPYRPRVGHDEVTVLLEHCRNWIDAISAREDLLK